MLCLASHNIKWVKNTHIVQFNTKQLQIWFLNTHFVPNNSELIG